MQTTVESSTTQSGTYHQIRPNNLPERRPADWPWVYRGWLRQCMGDTGLMQDLNVDIQGVVHLDLKPCTDIQQAAALERLLSGLHALGFHTPAWGVEHRELPHGRE